MDLNKLSDQQLKELEASLIAQVAKYNVLQAVKKICLNSCYGAIGSQHFRFYELDQAEAITISGKLTIRYVGRRINEFLNEFFKTENTDYLLYSDTDSVFFNFKPIADRYVKQGKTSAQIVELLHQICKQIVEPKLKEIFDDLCKYLNAYEPRMAMVRDKIMERTIWTRKKRYYGTVWDVEGTRYDKPKIKITGLEAIRSNTPGSCREALKKAYEIAVTKTENDMIEFVAEFKKKFFSLPFHEIGTPTGVNGILKYSNADKGMPFNVRAAITYNNLLIEHGLDHKYERIKEGGKVKLCYMKLPNPTGENVVACLNFMPPELGMEKFIDYDRQFEKSFLTPLRFILDIIGWADHKRSSLDEFFN